MTPSSTATIQIHLTSRGGWVTTPAPTTEHGGLHPVPCGVHVELLISDAHHLPTHTARQIAGALANAVHVDIVGTSYQIKGIKAALDQALKALEPAIGQSSGAWGTEEGAA